jgi:hypothetical protein
LPNYCLSKPGMKLLYLFSLTLTFLSLASFNQVEAVSLSPSIQDLLVKRGDNFQSKIIIQNDEPEELAVVLEASDVKFTTAGTPQFLGSQNIPPDSLLWWLNFDKGPYILKPGEKKEVILTISVPMETLAGGHYGAILASKVFDPNLQNTTGLALKSKLASLMFADVEGDVKRAFDIQKFTVDNQINEGLPINFEVTINNQGNNHLQPHGVIRVVNDFTAKEVGKLLINEDFSYLFANNQRSFSLSWDKYLISNPGIFYFGKYSAFLEMSAPGANQTASRLTFWILPIKTLILLIVAILLAVGGLIGYTKKITRAIEK